MADPVVRSVVVRAQAERVFSAFVEVDEVLHWLADGAVIGARPGGGWGLGWYADPDSDAGYTLRGVFEVFEPPSRLVVSGLTFSTPEGPELGPMRMTVEIDGSEGDGTRVVVTQEGMGEAPPWDEYRAGIGPGWERILSDLKGWLEEGRALPGR